MWLWLLVFALSVAEVFFAIQEIWAIGMVLKNRRTVRGVFYASIKYVVPWTAALVAVSLAGGLLIYRENPWLSVPEWLGAQVGCVASLMYRKHRSIELRKKRQQEEAAAT